MNTTGFSSKQLAMIAIVDLISVLIWAILMVLDVLTAGPINTLDDAFNYVSNPSIFFFLNYLNAIIFTLATTVLFVGLYLHLNSESHSPWLLIGLIFVPIYSIMNIFAYGSQITIIPMLLPLLELAEYQTGIKVVILLLIQVYPGTVVNTINLSAYGILAIPSLIFSVELLRESHPAKKISGILLGLNGISCVISVVALLFLLSPLAGVASIFGAFFTILALFFLAFGLFRG
ncbi:MAG: hypothetical protein ACFFDT_09485 [Candidatus Hodarchaeota archaeon]